MIANCLCVEMSVVSSIITEKKCFSIFQLTACENVEPKHFSQCTSFLISFLEKNTCERVGYLIIVEVMHVLYTKTNNINAFGSVNIP